MRILKITLPLLLAATGVQAQKAYLSGNTGLSVYDTTGIQAQGNICCGQLQYVASSPDGYRVYATNPGTKKIYYVDKADKIIDSMALPAVGDIVCGETSNVLFVVGQTHIYIVNPMTKTYDSTSATRPSMIEKRPGKTEVWVSTDQSISVYNYNAKPVKGIQYMFSLNTTSTLDEVKFTKDGSIALMPDVLDNKTYKIIDNSRGAVCLATQ